MKTRARFLALVATALFSSGILYAQCTPDENCVDTELPGQFCPENLADAGLDVLYDETVTVIPPGSFKFGELEFSILHIKIDSVKNLPPGLDYFPNADMMYPDTAYCIQLTGTPTQLGDYTLAIYVTATVDLAGTPTEAQVLDTTSIKMTVVEVLGIDPGRTSEFLVNQNAPNPFSDVTRLAFYAPFSDRITLKVYNILGVQVHQETKGVAPGAHYFGFDGALLDPGTYLYRVETSETYYTGKMMKTN